MTVTLPLPYGTFVTAADDYMNAEIVREGFYCPELQPYFDRFGEGDLCLDVGAHVGLYSGYLASRGCTVYACERHPIYLPLLAINVRRNAWDGQVSILPTFCYSRAVCMEEALENPTRASNTWLPVASARTNAIRLDTIPFGSPVRLIKIDAQGADLHVLQGAEAIIQRDRPCVLIEYEGALALRHGHTADDYRAWIADHGYTETAINGWNAYLTP